MITRDDARYCLRCVPVDLECASGNIDPGCHDLIAFRCCECDAVQVMKLSSSREGDGLEDLSDEVEDDDSGEGA